MMKVLFRWNYKLFSNIVGLLEDENGINTASGIGHDIVAILDGDESNPYVLNEYYETENDDYTSKITISVPKFNARFAHHFCSKLGMFTII